MPGRYRSDTLEQRISIERLEQAVNIFGSFDENIRLLEQEFSVTVVNRDGELRVEGEPEDTMLAWTLSASAPRAAPSSPRPSVRRSISSPS